MGNTSAVMQNVKDVPEEFGSPGSAMMRKDIHLDVVSDPRSPSEQFPRTPIEVKNSALRSTRTRSRISQPVVSLGATERGSYETYADGVLNEVQRLRLISNDPRSPTAGIIRTPIQVFSPEGKNGENEESPVSLTSASSENYETGDDLQFSVNDGSTGSLGKDLKQSHKDVFRTPMMIEELPKTDFDNVFVDEDTPPTTASETKLEKKKKGYENEVRIKLFHTPPAKACGLKVRVPLRAFSANESLPQQILRAKQAHGLMQSMDAENTPPKGISDSMAMTVPSYLK